MKCWQSLGNIELNPEHLANWAASALPLHALYENQTMPPTLHEIVQLTLLQTGGHVTELGNSSVQF